MTPQQVNQVQTSFIKIVPIADRAAALFYGRLFEMAPETRALFCSDVGGQGRKLMAALATVVNSLGDFEAIVPIARDLAKRHVGRSIMRSSDPPCCGPWNRGSAMNSPRRCASPGNRGFEPISLQRRVTQTRAYRQIS